MKKSPFTYSLLLFFVLGCKSQPPRVNLNVPDWAKDAIWYQIFPERFCNGDTTNDPAFRDTFGSWPHDTLSPWQKNPWTADWYFLQPWEKANGKDFNYNAGRRRFGGDLQGILNKLDYLQELGVNAIYLNPIFEAPTPHKYDGARHHHVDNNFGPNPAKDRVIWEQENFIDPTTWKWTTADSLFLKLIAEVHRRRMHIIIDGVFNHIGVTNPVFQDVVQKGPASAYADWFIIKRWDDPATPANEFDYQGWYGIKDLPEIRRAGDDLASGPKAYFKAIVQRWMDPNRDGDPSDGIDGWRLDVAELVPKGFWRDFRKWVREINPQAYLTGEVWWEDYRNHKMFNAAPWLQGDIFDAVMNYRFADALLKYFVDTKDAFDAKELNQRLRELRDEYPPEVNYVLMNLMDSHDTERLASMVVNPNRMIDHASSASSKEYNFDVRKPNTDEIKTQKLIIAFQMLYLGAPMIYYGGEAGLWGADDPDDRKPMLWPEMIYEPEKSHPLGKRRPVDAVAFDRELFEYYKTFIAIRRENNALRRGDYQHTEVSQSPEVFAFVRDDDIQGILCVFNRAASPAEIKLPENFVNGEYLFGRKNLSAMPDNLYSLAGKSVAVLKMK
ncbi:MAG: glycoside hydrolase family 13 protein [candidate division KSB1 bacterium]|nr:glycoside hydrolase family 13 protein [candidate division KSB1 bacterium]MDZ7365130.1 glycoside hydrolase family 13 protein [candidate division KSB1 bacterium]MDZ7404340.1 glycoside hydrolase family 13 protein [candidate division KSB1 bacterium]